MNTFQLMCFLEVAENLSFARAAEHLHVTQPAVTQQIQTLEEELGTKLFVRTTRSVRLTDEGKIFINDAQSILTITDRAKKRFEGDTDKESLFFSVGSGNYACLFIMARVLDELRREHTRLHPRLRVLPNSLIFRMLEEGDLDAAVVFKEHNFRNDSISYRELTRTPIVCICQENHPFAELSSVGFDDIKRENLVALIPQRASKSLLEVQGRLIGEKMPEELYFCESPEEVVTLVMAGFGVALLPEVCIPRAVPVKRIGLEEGGHFASFGVYLRRGDYSNELFRSFVRKMQPEFEKYGAC